MMNIRQEIEAGMYTTDTARAKSYLKWEFQEIEKIWAVKGLPEGFDDGEVVPLFRKDGAGVMLMNDRKEICVLAGNMELAIWHCCEKCSNEGFDLRLHGEGSLCDACYLSDTDGGEAHKIWGIYA